MTYNTSKIMKAAWERYNQFRPGKFCRVSFGYSLHRAWAAAKQEASMKVVNIAEYRARLEQELLMLSFSDAIGTAAKMDALKDQIRALPKAA